MTNTSQSPAAAGTPPSTAPSDQVNRDLVLQVAEKVYAMLMEELRIERERSRPGLNSGGRSLGGRSYG